MSEDVPFRLVVALRVHEESCTAWDGAEAVDAGFAPSFPTPYDRRVSPGHLLAVVDVPDAAPTVVWRWYDAVVLSQDEHGVRIWEPAHGEVVARPRFPSERRSPGTRAYASAGLPGADWWVGGPVVRTPAEAAVEGNEVAAFLRDNGALPPFAPS